MQSLMNDLRYALRQLRHAPGFTVTAVLTLALGIGATTAIFSVVDSVLIAPLPYRNAPRIVALHKVYVNPGRESQNLSGPDYLDLKAQTRSFASVAYYHGGETGVQLSGHAVFTGVEEVSPEFPVVFGVAPSAGAPLSPQEATHQALISAAFARDNFGGGGAALGKSLSVEERVYTIVGVLPPAFDFPQNTSIWVGGPAVPESMERTANNYHAVALLQPGVTPVISNLQLGTLSSRLAHAYGATLGTVRFSAVGLKEALTGKVRAALLLLLAAVGLVLLIVCVNVAHLQFARAATHRREVAVRAALGAGRGRILREHAAEALVLALAGGVSGLLLGVPLTQVFVHLAPDDLPQLGAIHLNPGVVAFCFAVSLLTTLLTALAPAWRATRIDPAGALKVDGLRSGGDHHAGAWRSALMTTEIALTFTLAIAAGLVVRTLTRLSSTDPGYRMANRLVISTNVPAETEAEHQRRSREMDRLMEQLALLPGVERVAGVMGLPGGQYGSDGLYIIPEKGQSFSSSGLGQAYFNAVSPGYFATMGIPLLRGRDFDSSDTLHSEPVVLVSAALARASFGDENPIGHTLQCGLDERSYRQPARIVGVVGNVRQNSPAEQPGPAIYMPLDQHPYRSTEIEVVMKTKTSAASLVDSVRKEIGAFDPQIATRFTTMEETVAASTAAQRFRTWLLSGFAALALLLAGAGVFSVMSYTVAQRRLEFGVRMALGSSRSALLRLVLRQALAAAVMGVGVGLLLSALLSRAMASMLFGVSTLDAVTYAAASLLIFAAVTLAAYRPARRAAIVDPIQALREE